MQSKVDTREQFFRLFPVFFLFSVYPLITIYHSYRTNLEKEVFFSSQTMGVNFFQWGKEWAFLFLSIWMLLFMLWSFNKKRVKNYSWKQFLPLFLYCGLALLSSLASSHRKSCFLGGYEQFESVWCLMGYGLVAFYTSVMVKSRQEWCLLGRGLSIGALLAGIIGTLQMAGFDLWASKLGQLLSLSFLAEGGTYQRSYQKGLVYGTFYNPNYVGTYVCLVVPLLLVFFLAEKNRKFRILALLAVAMNLAMVFGAGSAGGILCLVFMVGVVGIWILKDWTKTPGRFLKCFLLCVAGLGILLFLTRGLWLKVLSNQVVKSESTNTNTLTAVNTGTKGVTFYIGGRELHVSFQFLTDGESQLNFTDESGKQLSYHVDSKLNGYVVDEKEFSDLVFRVGETKQGTLGLLTNVDQYQWLFVYDSQQKRYCLYNQYEKNVRMAPYLVGSNRFDKYLSGRGYLWRGTLRQLPKDLLIGEGADCYVYTFPYEDYLGRMQAGFKELIVTKPHNIFLQIWVQTGLLSLLAIGIWIVMVLRTLLRKAGSITEDSRKQKWMIRLMLLVVTGYWVIGLVNDSTICVAPLYFAALGGMCSQYHLFVIES